VLLLRGAARGAQAGVLSGLIVETTADYCPEREVFVLHTPTDSAAKNWISQGCVRASYTHAPLSRRVVESRAKPPSLVALRPSARAARRFEARSARGARVAVSP
jgi:hypothetical protein